jgi:hypothetical protein
MLQTAKLFCNNCGIYGKKAAVLFLQGLGQRPKQRLMSFNSSESGKGRPLWVDRNVPTSGVRTGEDNKSCRFALDVALSFSKKIRKISIFYFFEIF